MTKKSRKKIGPQARVPQKRRELTEERLLAAAIASFSKCGYDGTTTKDIARRAGANEALIVRYFGGKEGLLLATIKRFLDQRRNEALPYPPQATLADELECHVQFLLEDMEENSDFYKILFNRSSVDTKLSKKIIDILPKAGDPRIIERAKVLRSQGLIPKSLPDELIVLVPFQAFCAMNLATGTLGLDPEKMKSQLLKLVRACVEGLLAMHKD